MRKQLLKQIIDISYTKNELDKEKIDRIVQALSRSELKAYIHALKARLQKNQVIITSATDISSFKKDFLRVFPDKKLVFHTNKSLGAGFRIIQNDMIYEINLLHTLNELQEFVYD